MSINQQTHLGEIGFPSKNLVDFNIKSRDEGDLRLSVVK